MNYRRIARQLGVDHKSVINWVNAHVAQQTDAPLPSDVNNAEMDELYTFVGSKKRVYVMTLVDRRTSCILSWAVERERSESCLQQLVDDAPQAAYSFSHLFATYRQLIYHSGRYTPIPTKSETYQVEGGNAEMRYYLARLARRSHCIKALRRAIKLFVYAWNSRQLQRLHFPKYAFHFRDFI